MLNISDVYIDLVCTKKSTSLTPSIMDVDFLVHREPNGSLCRFAVTLLTEHKGESPLKTPSFRKLSTKKKKA